MTLYRLKTAPTVLVEDDYDKNVLPLLLELVNNEKNDLHLCCYEKPASFWRCVFKNNVVCHEDFNVDQLDRVTHTKCSVIVDSINQMSLCIGWSECLKILKKLIFSPHVLQLILIFHKDCLPHFSKLQINLHHLASAIVSYDTTDSSKIWVQLKKSGKIVKSEEILVYDSKTTTLKSNIVIKKDLNKEEEPAKTTPSSLTTFKIEMDQTEKLEKYKLKLPYMSKINEGQSKVYYEPDFVDDWDEEDPDEDLDI